MNTLPKIQGEVGEWAKQFGENESKNEDFNNCAQWFNDLEDNLSELPLTQDTIEMICGIVKQMGFPLQELSSFLGMVEELGELAGVMVKRHQGRQFQDREEYQTHIKDGLGDLTVFKCDFANRVGIDLESNLMKVWGKVKNRSQKTWVADKQAENDPTNRSLSEKDEMMPFTNQGFNEPSEEETRIVSAEGPPYFETLKIVLNNLGWDWDQTILDDYSDFVRILLEVMGIAPPEDVPNATTTYREEFDPTENNDEAEYSVGVLLEALSKDYTNSRINMLDIYQCILNRLNLDSPSVRQKLYQETAIIGLKYGDQNQTNVEEGIITKLKNLYNSAECRLHGRDATDMREQFNEIAKLRPDLLGEPVPLHLKRNSPKS